MQEIEHGDVGSIAGSGHSEGDELMGRREGHLQVVKGFGAIGRIGDVLIIPANRSAA